MNWYKESQQLRMVTFDQIVRAIDELICENGYFSYNDSIGSSVSKAAQVIAPPKRRQVKDNIISLDDEKEKAVMDLVRQGIVTSTEISRRSGIDQQFIKKILLKNNVNDADGRGIYYNDIFGKDVGNIVDKMNNSFEEGPTLKEVAQKLGTSKEVIASVCKTNGWDFKELKTERRRRIATFVGGVVDELEKENKFFSVRRVKDEVNKRTGMNFKETSVLRYITESGRSTPGQKKSFLMQLFFNYFLQNQRMGFDSFFKKYGKNKKYVSELKKIIDRFFRFYMDEKGCFINDIDFKELNICQIGGRRKASDILFLKLKVLQGSLSYKKNKN